MSKERELLKRVRDTLLGLKETYYDLYWDIQTVLDHPSLDLREPLSDGATADMYHTNKKATHPDSYWSGVYDAEKAHGIGGGE